MIKSKYLSAIVAVTMCLALLGSIAMAALAGSAAATVTDYEKKLFNGEIVTIDIQVDEDDWQGLLDNAQAKEYISADLVINGDLFSSVGIRTKGNSSLTQAGSSGNNRYSLQLNPNKYVKGQSFYGLDTMCINNIISDATYMKDAIVYDIMDYLDVPSPLTNYASVTVNGEDYGLFMLLERYDDSFLDREYNTTAGELYNVKIGMGERSDFEAGEEPVRPDSQGDDSVAAGESADGDTGENNAGGFAEGGMPDMQGGEGEMTLPEGMEGQDGTMSPEGMEGQDGTTPPEGMEGQEGMTPPEGMEGQDGMTPPEGMEGQDGMSMPEGQENMTPPDGMGEGGMPTLENSGESSESTDDSSSDSGDTQESMGEAAEESSSESTDRQTFGGMGGGNMGGGMGGFSGGGGSLVYTDDDPESYSSIFDNAVSNTVSDNDKSQLITAIQKLNEGEDLEEYWDVDEILRYLAAHTFVVNLDSYTSSMQQNYYLYESNGLVSVLPWDYNLAFGGFQSGDASSAVNFPIDTPVSGVEMEDRPLISQLLAVDEYLEKYHEYLNDIVEGYVNSGLFAESVARIDSQISEYVKTDATAYYTYDEYVEAVDALITFVDLRAESVAGQLDGSVPSTTDAQSENAQLLIDTGDLNLSTMGSQGGGGGGGMGSMSETGGGFGQGRGNMSRDAGNTEGESGEVSGGQGDAAADGGDTGAAVDNGSASDTSVAAGTNTTADSSNDSSDASAGGYGVSEQGSEENNNGGNTEPGNMPDMSVMSEIMAELQDGELTEDGRAKLEEMGFSEEEIEQFLQMAQGTGRSFGNDGSQTDGENNGGLTSFMGMGGGTTTGSAAASLTAEDWAMYGILLAVLLAAIVFMACYKRRKWNK